ncbi:MAG: hypothetical protein Q4A62_05245 [Eikenella sp.]|nr:hypothetical protein [Eikenella sp.]
MANGQQPSASSLSRFKPPAGFQNLFMVFLHSGFSRQKQQMQGENADKIEHLASIFVVPPGATQQMRLLTGQQSGLAKLKYRRNRDHEQVLK